jgi:anti-anti-sigma factor
MRTEVCEYLHVFKVGRLTIIGFTAKHALSAERADDCRKRLEQLAEEHGRQELIVDLYELPIVSSWNLGMLASLQRMGIRVHLYHPSAEIREILQVTHLDEVMDVRGEVAKRE